MRRQQPLRMRRLSADNCNPRLQERGGGQSRAFGPGSDRRPCILFWNVGGTFSFSRDLRLHGLGGFLQLGDQLFVLGGLLPLGVHHRSGARETNFSLESFCSTPRRPFWAFSISLRIRSSSAAMSTSSLRADKPWHCG